MSVIIKGMEMPTSCDECEFCKRDISSYDWCCIPMTNGRNKPLGEPAMKPDWCPLVPIPPHGRLIDADALKKMLDDEVARLLGKGIEYLDYHVDTLFSDFKHDVDKMPTIIEAEEEDE